MDPMIVSKIMPQKKRLKVLKLSAKLKKTKTHPMF
jgi:hypothetical protein